MKKSESTKYYQASSLVRLTIHWWWRCKFIQPVNLVKLSIHIQCTAILPSHLLWRTLYLWTSRHAQGCPDSRDSNSKQRKIEMTRSLLSKRFSETLSASFHHLSGTHRPCCEEVIQIKRLRVREDIGALHWITWHRAADPTANPKSQSRPSFSPSDIARTPMLRSQPPRWPVEKVIISRVALWPPDSPAHKKVGK